MFLEILLGTKVEKLKIRLVTTFFDVSTLRFLRKKIFFQKKIIFLMNLFYYL